MELNKIDDTTWTIELNTRIECAYNWMCIWNDVGYIYWLIQDLELAKEIFPCQKDIRINSITDIMGLILLIVRDDLHIDNKFI